MKLDGRCQRRGQGERRRVASLDFQSGRRDVRVRLNHGEKLPRCHVAQFLHDAAGPFDANHLRIGCIAQTEVRHRFVLGEDQTASANLAQLPNDASTDDRLDAYFGSDAGAIGKSSVASHRDPGVAVAVVEIELAVAVPIHVKEIDETVPVRVRAGEAVVAPTGMVGLDNRAGGDFGKRAVTVVEVKKIFGTGRHQIEPAVIVEVQPDATG